MTLKQWLEQTIGRTVKPGDAAWVVHTDGPGKSRIDETTIKTVGRTYITTNDSYESKYGILHEDQDHLYENTDWGYRSVLYLSKSAAEESIRKEDLSIRFRQNWSKWIDQASTSRLEAAIAVLSGTCSDLSVETFLDIWRHEPLEEKTDET